MLKPIIKEKGITKTERLLAMLAEKNFLGLWSYPNVYRDEGILKNGTGQELGDLLVFFDDTLLIFSDKDIAFPEHTDIAVAWSRWYRKSVKESAKQLYGAEAFVRNHPHRLFLDKKCSVRFPFDLSSPGLKIHLIAVTCNSYEPSKRYFDTFAIGSSGTLMCRFDFSEDDVLKHPFHISDINPKKTFIHVLDEYSLEMLLAELDTGPDFIHYLKTKENAVRNLNLVSAAGEEEILAFYLQEKTSDGYGDIAHPMLGDRSVNLIIPEGEWKNFRGSLDYLLLDIVRKNGHPWLKLLRLFSECILEAKVGEGMDLPLLSHERSLRAMASENRSSRAILTKALLEKYESVPSNIRSARLIQSPCHRGRLYVFLFFPHHPLHEDYEEYRRERTACMQLYAIVAKYKYPEMSEILVFGADSKGSMGASETIIAFDTSDPSTPEEQREAQKIMRTHKILNTVTGDMRMSHGNGGGTKIHPGPRYGRNAMCPLRIREEEQTLLSGVVSLIDSSQI